MENRKLKAMLVQKKYTYKEIAKKMNISATTFNKKINDGKFTVLEAKLICKILALTTDESADIFLN